VSGVGDKSRLGWWGLPCWNGLSDWQKDRLIVHGNLPMGRKEPEGECENGAEVAIETMADDAPGARFYCLDCGMGYLALLKFGPVPGVP